MFFTDFEEVEHLCTSAVTAIGSLQKQVRTPRRVLFKSGPLVSISLREIPLCLTLELNTTLIWPGFCRWWTPNIGRYHVSSPSFNGGAGSACFSSNTLCMKSMKCFMSDFFSSFPKRWKTLRLKVGYWEGCFMMTQNAMGQPKCCNHLYRLVFLAFSKKKNSCHGTWHSRDFVTLCPLKHLTGKITSLTFQVLCRALET